MKNKIIKIFLISIVAFYALSSIVFAYGIPAEYCPINSPFCDSYSDEADREAFIETSDDAVMLLQILAGGLLYFAAPIAILMIVLAGLKMVTQGADPDKATEAKKHLSWTILGLLLIILSYSIVKGIIVLTVDTSETSSAPATTEETSGENSSNTTPSNPEEPPPPPAE